jgi:hypothetical protein
MKYLWRNYGILYCSLISSYANCRMSDVSSQWSKDCFYRVPFEVAPGSMCNVALGRIFGHQIIYRNFIMNK